MNLDYPQQPSRAAALAGSLMSTLLVMFFTAANFL